MIQIPDLKTKKLFQSNRSNLAGSLWASWNLDLSSNVGAIRLSPRLMVSSSTEFIATLTTAPCAFRRYNSLFWTISGTKVHVSGSDILAASFTADATAGTPTNCDVTKSDLEVFNNELYVTTDTNVLYYYNGSVWASVSVGSADTTPKPMTRYGALLYVATGLNKVYSISTGHAATLLLTLPNSQQITCIRAGSNKIWITTLDMSGDSGYVYEWDGASATTNKSYKLTTQGALSCIIKDDVPWIVDTAGRLLAFNGGTFVEIARLPIFNTLLLKATSNVNDRFIHPNGMSIIDGEVCMLIANTNGESTGSINDNLPSGVWAYNQNNGLYHRYSVSYHDDDDASTLITDYGQNKISVAGALQEFKLYNNSASDQGTFLAGVTYYTNATSTRSAVLINDRNNTVLKYGYFITSWIQAEALKDNWQKMFARFRYFLSSLDEKIILKYRQIEYPANTSVRQDISITWDNSTSVFKTQTNLSSSSFIGKEVEITQGQGAGKCAHIVSVSTPNSIDYYVTLDEVFTGVTTGTAKARVREWIKIGKEDDLSSDVAIFAFPMNTSPSSKIQIKCCMQFYNDDELYDIIIINKPHTLLS